MKSSVAWLRVMGKAWAVTPAHDHVAVGGDQGEEVWAL